MKPLRITAKLLGGIDLPSGGIAIDSLLAWVVAQERGLVAGFSEVEEIPIPVAKSPCGRFHMASFSLVVWDQYESRHTNRRFPLPVAQLPIVAPMNRVLLTGGINKSYRIPTQLRHAEDDELSWVVVGDRAEIERLLTFATHLGRRRGVGRGKVASWTVDEFEPWSEGFPVVRDGLALRPLPVDWPGLREPATAVRTLTFPYWDRTREELCAVPELGC